MGSHSHRRADAFPFIAASAFLLSVALLDELENWRSQIVISNPAAPRRVDAAVALRYESIPAQAPPSRAGFRQLEKNLVGPLGKALAVLNAVTTCARQPGTCLFPTARRYH